MNIFDEAIRKGLLNAARDNPVMRINQLLGELNAAVHDLTDGKVSIGLSGWSRANAPEGSPGVLQSLPLLDKVRRYKLVAYREGYLWESAERLAEWSISDKNWHCTISAEGFARVCDDVKELKMALLELMCSARVGGLLKKVVDFEPGL